MRRCRSSIYGPSCPWSLRSGGVLSGAQRGWLLRHNVLTDLTQYHQTSHVHHIHIFKTLFNYAKTLNNLAYYFFTAMRPLLKSFSGSKAYLGLPSVQPPSQSLFRLVTTEGDGALVTSEKTAARPEKTLSQVYCKHSHTCVRIMTAGGGGY